MVVNRSAGIKTAYHHVKTTAQKGVEGISFASESTESFKKIFQVIKGIIELVGIFTTVAAFSPVINAAKVIGITIGGFDVVGRIKEWVVPDKNGQTLLHKHWTKIISRVHLAFANIIDTLKMLEFFQIFKIIKLGALAAQMSKVYFFKVIFDHFPGLEVIKHPFIAFSSSWSIFDSSLTIHRKREALKHINHKKRKWDNLSNRSYERQLEFFEARIDKYETRIENYKKIKLTKKLNKYDQKKLNKAMDSLPRYEKLVDAMSEDNVNEHADLVKTFADRKSQKWNQKVKNIKIDFVKGSIAITCEILKIFVVSTALILSVTMVGWVFLPGVLLVLGLLSNGAGLTKFLVDKLVAYKPVPRIKVPKIKVPKLA